MRFCSFIGRVVQALIPLKLTYRRLHLRGFKGKEHFEFGIKLSRGFQLVLLTLQLESLKCSFKCL